MANMRITKLRNPLLISIAVHPAIHSVEVVGGKDNFDF
jgi:hypothetical protein